jgi:hypothetical protein
MNYQTITTRYIRPTDRLGARIKASIQGSHWVSKGWDHALSDEGNHLHAARSLAESLGWAGDWVGDTTPEGYAFVRRDAELTFSVGGA